MSTVATVVAGVLRAYQVLVSPVLGPSCRFAPSCSEYARQAVLAHGIARGGWLAVRRIGRCHPFNPGGYDPPPLTSRRAG
jgi:putative membrane protein insertion efficiency factor